MLLAWALAILVPVASGANVRINGGQSSAAHVRYDSASGDELVRMSASDGWLNVTCEADSSSSVNVRAANFVTEGGIDVNELATRLAAAEATISTLQSTVSTLQTALAAKLDSSAAASTYLTQATASSTYLRQSTASSTYLGIGNAASMYLTQNAVRATCAANVGTTYPTAGVPYTWRNQGLGDCSKHCYDTNYRYWYWYPHACRCYGSGRNTGAEPTRGTNGASNSFTGMTCDLPFAPWGNNHG